MSLPKKEKSCLLSLTLFVQSDIIIDIEFIMEHNYNFDPIEIGAHTI